MKSQENCISEFVCPMSWKGKAQFSPSAALLSYPSRSEFRMLCRAEMKPKKGYSLRLSSPQKRPKERHRVVESPSAQTLPREQVDEECDFQSQMHQDLPRKIKERTEERERERDMASNGSRQGSEFDEQVLIEERSQARILTLNRPRQLNALSYHMVSRLLKAFAAYEEDPNVNLVILKGKGRAFCAGGDVAAVVHYVTDGYWHFGANFFRNEFTLNYIMATNKKPQVSILNGIVMGGGAGVSIHGMFRVATENSVFAMPETALGLFPDIGSSYFLSRLHGFFGEYAGLTGARLDGAEMLACGLATHFVPSTRLPLLEEALFNVGTADPAVINAVIDQFSQRVPLKEKSAFHRMDTIDKCFSKRTVEEILSALEQEAAKGADELISASIQSLKKASPMSLKISLRSIREGRLQSIDQCLIREYRMVCHVLRKEVSKDFFEGCRALLLDKDKNPKWEPSKLELISNDMVDKYFAKVDDEVWEDLKLPYRPTHTSRL